MTTIFDTYAHVYFAYILLSIFLFNAVVPNWCVVLKFQGHLKHAFTFIGKN